MRRKNTTATCVLARCLAREQWCLGCLGADPMRCQALQPAGAIHALPASATESLMERGRLQLWRCVQPCLLPSLQMLVLVCLLLALGLSMMLLLHFFLLLAFGWQLWQLQRRWHCCLRISSPAAAKALQ